MSIFVKFLGKSRAQEKNKLRHHHVISTSVLFSNIALDQSAGEKSLSYGKKNIFDILHLTFTTFGRLLVIRTQYNYFVDQS